VADAKRPEGEAMDSRPATHHVHRLPDLPGERCEKE